MRRFAAAQRGCCDFFSTNGAEFLLCFIRVVCGGVQPEKIEPKVYCSCMCVKIPCLKMSGRYLCLTLLLVYSNRIHENDSFPPSKIYYSILVLVSALLHAHNNESTTKRHQASSSRCPPSNSHQALHLMPPTMCASQDKRRFPFACSFGYSQYISASSRWCCSLLHAAASVRPACSTASFNKHSSITAVLSPLPFNQIGLYLQSIAD